MKDDPLPPAHDDPAWVPNVPTKPRPSYPDTIPLPGPEPFEAEPDRERKRDRERELIPA